MILFSGIYAKHSLRSVRTPFSFPLYSSIFVLDEYGPRMCKILCVI